MKISYKISSLQFVRLFSHGLVRPVRLSVHDNSGNSSNSSTRRNDRATVAETRCDDRRWNESGDRYAQYAYDAGVSFVPPPLLLLPPPLLLLPPPLPPLLPPPLPPLLRFPPELAELPPGLLLLPLLLPLLPKLLPPLVPLLIQNAMSTIMTNTITKITAMFFHSCEVMFGRRDSRKQRKRGERIRSKRRSLRFTDGVPPSYHSYETVVGKTLASNSPYSYNRG